MNSTGNIPYMDKIGIWNNIKQRPVRGLHAHAGEGWGREERGRRELLSLNIKTDKNDG